MKWIFYSLLLVNIGYLSYQLLWPRESIPAVGSTFAESENRILLLSERTGVSVREQEVTDVLENPMTVEKGSQNQICRGLGPFQDILSAQDIAERLNASGFPIDMRAVDVPADGADYRVVMPPLPSLQDAFRRLRELKSRGIDSYVIAEGPDTQGISLGVFSSEVAARNQQEDLLAEGYETEIRVIDRVVRGFWLFAVEPRPFPPDILDEVSTAYSDVNVAETACMN